MKALLKPSLNWLLVFVPAAVVLDFGEAETATWTFIASCIAIIFYFMPAAAVAGAAGH
jgi:hypothetical protein